MTTEIGNESSPFKDLVAELILGTHVPGKHAARNAFAHIETAWKIKDIDPTMAAFRAITGVEEAATAIFHALKRQKYNSAHLLNKDRHFHKAAVQPFFQAIAGHFARLNFKAQIVCNTTKEPKKLEIVVTLPSGPLKGRSLRPIPPLNFSVTMDGRPYDFADQLDKIVTEKNAKTFCKYSNELANFRNKILYASNEGIPSVQITEGNLKRKEDIILSYLIVYLLISQYDEQQLFVQQSLDAFLRILNLSEKICT
jgi:hypothetical protein